MTQEKLAEYAECSNSHIGQIERGRRIPSLTTTIKIAEALSVTVDQLLAENYSFPEKVYLKELAERMDRYPLGKRIKACESLLNYLDTMENFNQIK
ncbi:MAG: helix-turn-helix transcriptional regulator [Oscillospiraceae bacterium]